MESHTKGNLREKRRKAYVKRMKSSASRPSNLRNPPKKPAGAGKEVKQAARKPATAKLPRKNPPPRKAAAAKNPP